MNKILVADDDKLIRWSLKEIFSQKGYEVDTAASSLEAIQQAENSQFSLIFTDFEIDKEDSLQVIKRIKTCQPDAKIIIIEKPFQSAQILSIAKEAIK